VEIKVSTEHGRVPVTILHVGGDIDSASYQAFQAKAQELIKGGTQYLLIDLSHVPFVGSAGLRAIHAIFSQLRLLYPDVSDEEMSKKMRVGQYKSPNLKLLNPSKETHSVLSLGGFDLYIEIYDDLKIAIASF
jgi:hypothetical protein